MLTELRLRSLKSDLCKVITTVLDNAIEQSKESKENMEFMEDFKETVLVLMSGDMFAKIYETNNDYVYVKDVIRSWADEFVDAMIGTGYPDNDADLILSLEHFENEKFKELQ